MKSHTGRFYYDFENMRQKQDYGKTALTFIGAPNNRTKSKFYFVMKPVGCFYVVSEDPGTHADIPIPAPDFMAKCAALGLAHYVGREKLANQWADHYNCSVFYEGETDSFQT